MSDAYFSIDHRRRTSKLWLLTGLLLMVVFGLWVTDCFSTTVYSLKAFSVVPRAPYQDALPPLRVVEDGLPYNYVKGNAPHLPSVRAIQVTPGGVKLLSGGVTISGIAVAPNGGASPTITLATLTDAIANPQWIERTGRGTYVLKAALILQGIGLDATAPTTRAIEMIDKQGVFLETVGYGHTTIKGVRVATVRQPRVWAGALSPRPFVLCDVSATCDYAHDSFENLGWDWNRSYGITWINGATGSLSDSSVKGNFIGVYTQQVQGISVVGNKIFQSHLYGIDPHTFSTQLTISGNTVVENRAHGIILADHVTNSIISHNVSSRNGESGIDLYLGSSNNKVVGNTVSHNVGDGIELNRGSTNISIVGNSLTDNHIGLASYGGSSASTVRGNRVYGNLQSIHSVPLDYAVNTIDRSATGFVSVPPPRWSYLINDVLWPLMGLLVLWCFYDRRRNLLRGVAVQAGSGDDVLVPRRSSPLRLFRAYQHALVASAKAMDRVSPIGAVTSLRFAGPPAIVTQPLRTLKAAITLSKNETRFRPDIQGLRALAVIVVVIYHANALWIHGGYVGVDVFFVLSGFVITGVLLRERATSGKTSLLDFYARRARRIIPAASLVIVVSVLASYYLLGDLAGTTAAINGLWSSVFLANYHAIAVGTNYFSEGAAPSALLHFWSLAVEEQFYLVFPVLVILVGWLWREKSLRIKLGILLVVTVCASFVYSIINTHAQPVSAYYSPFTRSWELALGSLVAVLGPLCEKVPQKIAVTLGWGGLLGILYAVFFFNGGTQYPGSAVAVPVVSTALVVAMGAIPHRFGVGTILSVRPALIGGDLSYSLYLWHFPVIILATEFATSALTTWDRIGLLVVATLLALVSYYGVEVPLRTSAFLKEKSTRSVIMGVGVIASGVLVCGALSGTLVSPSSGGGSSVVAGSASLTALTKQVAAAATLNQLPANTTPAPSVSEGLIGSPIRSACIALNQSTSTVPLCQFGLPTAKKTIVLFGDSQAEMFANGFNKLAQLRHERLIVLAKPGCSPWLRVQLTPGLAPWPQCTAFHDFALREIAALHPDQIVVTGGVSSAGYTPAVGAGVQQVLQTLRQSSSHVAVLSNIPWYAGSARTLPLCLIVHASSLRSCDMPYTEFALSQAPYRQQLQLAAKQTSVSYINMDPLFCTTQSCPVVIGNHEVYIDGYHITWQFGEYISPALNTLLNPLYP